MSSALDYVDTQIGRMVSPIHKQGLAGSTTIIVTAKHGQSPQDPNQLITVQDGPIISAINAAWAQAHPSNTKLIVAGTDDDLWQSYLSDNSQAACDFVKNYLWNHTAQGYDVNDNPVTVQHSGLTQIWAGAAAANSSASRSTTATTRTCSARFRKASCTRSRPNSPNTVA